LTPCSSWKNNCPSIPRSAPFFCSTGRSDQPESAPLELVEVVLCEFLSARNVGGLPSDHVEHRIGAEGVPQTDLDQVDGQVRNVDPDPLATEALSGIDGSARTRKKGRAPRCRGTSPDSLVHAPRLLHERTVDVRTAELIYLDPIHVETCGVRFPRR
jgi:hypothetical protein